MGLSSTSLMRALLLASYAVVVQGDGTGLIGWGKTLYNPTCSFACRNVIRKQELSCTPASGDHNHGTFHNPVATPPDCFVKDAVFLKTMALCIDTYCPLSGNPSMGLLEDYWASHLGTGTLGNYQYVPAMSYHDALAAARSEEARAESHHHSTNHNDTSDEHDHEHEHGDMKRRTLAVRHGDHTTTEKTIPGLKTFNVSSALPMALGGSAVLNVTSFVSPSDWQMQYNYMSDFETNEAGHSTMTIVIAIVAIFLPVALSLSRHLPGLLTSRGWTYFQSAYLNPPTWGQRHREPVAQGIVPTRGQAWYIFIISFLNVVLLLAPYVINQPQASFPSTGMQSLSIIGNRAGSMAMGNVVALCLFAARNNVLFYVTDWSYSTYLLLHRWLGYWAIIHTIIHSFMLMANYVVQGTYSDELAREYWIWGIVGTVAASAIFPFSMLWVRQKFYEAFLASHVVLSLLFLIGYYYHIWYCYTYNWGYEIWMFIAAGIWAGDRVVRLGRMALGGSRTALVTVIPDTDGEYVRIDVPGSRCQGDVVYLCFPTLTWHFWETHPFSVACNGTQARNEPASTPSEASGDVVSPSKATDYVAEKSIIVGQSTAGDAEGPCATFFCRTRTGLTKALGARASLGSAGGEVRVRVLLEGPYNHSGRVASQISRCSSILCIAGGVGITACLSFLRSEGKDSKLFWSNRKPGLANEMALVLAQLPSNVQVETTVGQRLDLDSILGKELLQGNSAGTLAIVVCGPSSMADDVRHKVTWLARYNESSRPYVLVDEAFSW